MANYLYFEHADDELSERFNIKNELTGDYVVNGINDWRELITTLLDFLSDSADEIKRSETRTTVIGELNRIHNYEISSLLDDVYPEHRTTEELILTLLLSRLRESYKPLPKNRCPSLFISHRQIDQDFALRIAKLAEQHNFEYWLDILEPALQIISTNPLIPETLVPLMTACIIEIGLINCTHVIACMTPNSKGTMWIPYEYGRITEVPGVSKKACAWVHPDLEYLPEYMLLGELTVDEGEIKAWLSAEYKIHSRPTCILDKRKIAKVDHAKSLPNTIKPELPKVETEDERKERIKKEVEDAINNGLVCDLKQAQKIRIKRK